MVIPNLYNKGKRRCKRRRGNIAKVTENFNTINLFFNNINGLLSKRESLELIIKMEKPDLVALCETKLHLNSTFTIDGYETIKSNLKTGKEGILIAAKIGTFSSLDMIYQAENRNIMSVEVVYPKDSVNLVVVHGPQEGDPREVKENFYNNIKVEIERCISNNNRLIIAGDFNAKMDLNGNKIEANSGNAMLLKTIIEMYNLQVINFQKHTNGKWTRIQKKGGNETKSVLDYIIVDSNTVNLFKNTSIDESKIYTPYRIRTNNKIRSIVYSDHCSILTSIQIEKGVKRINAKVEKVKKWKLTTDGMKKYQEITEHTNIDIENLSNCENPYDEWLKHVEEILHLCFKRITVKVNRPFVDKSCSKAKRIRTILFQIAQRGKIQRLVVKTYTNRLIAIESIRIQRKKAKKIEETITSLTENDLLSNNAFWKLKKALAINECSHPQVIKSNGKIIKDPEEIKQEVKKEFEHRLRNREPDPNG